MLHSERKEVKISPPFAPRLSTPVDSTGPISTVHPAGGDGEGRVQERMESVDECEARGRTRVHYG